MRSMRTHMAWNVHTHMPRMLLPSRRRSRRSFISRAALLVKVMARICQGMMPRSSSMWAMRYVSTRVLPEPAPASTSSGPSTLSTALFCAGLSESMSIVMKQPSCVADGNVGRTSFWRVSLPSPRTAFQPSTPCAHDPYTFDVHCPTAGSTNKAVRLRRLPRPPTGRSPFERQNHLCFSCAQHSPACTNSEATARYNPASPSRALRAWTDRGSRPRKARRTARQTKPNGQAAPLNPKAA